MYISPKRKLGLLYFHFCWFNSFQISFISKILKSTQLLWLILKTLAKLRDCIKGLKLQRSMPTREAQRVHKGAGYTKMTLSTPAPLCTPAPPPPQIPLFPAVHVFWVNLCTPALSWTPALGRYLQMLIFSSKFEGFHFSNFFDFHIFFKVWELSIFDFFLFWYFHEPLNW